MTYIKDCFYKISVFGLTTLGFCLCGACGIGGYLWWDLEERAAEVAGLTTK